MEKTLKQIADYPLNKQQAALWFLGQSGFLIRSCGVGIAIDPYLSDSVAKRSPQLTRLYPPPIHPSALQVDLFIVTHDHLDHLDPETIAAYSHKESTTFIGPRFACDKLKQLHIPAENIIRIDSGQTQTVRGVTITGVYAVPNEPAVIDTCGYRVEFENGRSVYHSADTGFSPLLLECAPSAETALICINGHWGNLSVEEAADLANQVKPVYAIPHHYDLMALNAANPESFRYQMNSVNPKIQVKILRVLDPFVW